MTVAALLADRELPRPKSMLRWSEPYGANFRAAWEECWRGDWQLLLAIAAGADATELVAAARAAAALADAKTRDAFVDGDDARIFADKAAAAAELAADADEPQSALLDALRYATVSLTFVATGPKVHRALARIVRTHVQV